MTNFVTLPFAVPTDQAAAWLDELDFVDPYEGELDELRALLESAPTAEMHSWLSNWITLRWPPANRAS